MRATFRKGCFRIRSKLPSTSALNMRNSVFNMLCFDHCVSEHQALFKSSVRFYLSPDVVIMKRANFRCIKNSLTFQTDSNIVRTFVKQAEFSRALLALHTRKISLQPADVLKFPSPGERLRLNQYFDNRSFCPQLPFSS